MRDRGSWRNWRVCASTSNATPTNSTPLTAFHDAIRAVLDSRDAHGVRAERKIQSRFAAMDNSGLQTQCRPVIGETGLNAGEQS